MQWKSTSRSSMQLPNPLFGTLIKEYWITASYRAASKVCVWYSEQKIPIVDEGVNYTIDVEFK